jgi:phospholipase C
MSAKAFMKVLLAASLIFLQACNLGTLKAIKARFNTPTPTATFFPVPKVTPQYSGTQAPPASDQLLLARSKIKHIVIIMQENRSFDHYFGTFPGADGIPMQNGVPTVCIPNPPSQQCVKPYHNPKDINNGAAHTLQAAITAIDGGKMDGFLSVFKKSKRNCSDPNAPECVNIDTEIPDVMGWHDAREIPNYWAYAQNFVLQDHMFEPTKSWSLPDHLFMVSGWSAKCNSAQDPMSCVSDLITQINGSLTPDNPEIFAWTDLTYLLYKNNVSWAYYLTEGFNPDCADGEMTCKQEALKLNVPGIWNPLPYFTTVHEDNQLGNIQTTDNFRAALKNGTLPAVSWITPSGKISEHPPSSIRLARLTSQVW